MKTLGPKYYVNSANVLVAQISGYIDDSGVEHWPPVPSGSTEVSQPPDPTLDQYKTDKIAELSQAYSDAKQSDISFTNTAGITKTYQADKNSRDNLHDMLDGFQKSQTVPSGFYWVAKDNTQVLFTYADMQGLAEAMATRGATLFAKLQALKNQVRNVKISTTNPIQTVNAIVWK